MPESGIIWPLTLLPALGSRDVRLTICADRGVLATRARSAAVGRAPDRAVCSSGSRRGGVVRQAALWIAAGIARGRPSGWSSMGLRPEQPRTSRVVGRGNAPHRAAHARAGSRRSPASARRLAGALTLPTFTRSDAGAGALVLLVVTLVVGLPFAHVGEDLPEGRAYRAYFTPISSGKWRSSPSSPRATCRRGILLPERRPSLLLVDAPAPAVQHRAFAGTPCRSTAARQRVLVGAGVRGVLVNPVRHFVSSPWAAAIGCSFVLLGTSLEGIDRLWYGTATSRHFATRTSTRSPTGHYQGMRADGLHRLLLYQPQHRAGYLLGLSAVLALYQARDIGRPALFLLISGLSWARACCSAPCRSSC